MYRQVDFKAVLAAWLSYVVALVVSSRGRLDASALTLASLVGALMVLTGYAAASRTRPVIERSATARARTVGWALIAGLVLGVFNLSANVAIAAIHPDVEALLAKRFVSLDPLAALTEAPVTEEIGLRLFFMSGIAWLVARLTSSTRTIFIAALTVSAVVFAVLHLARPMPPDGLIAGLYSGALVAKYTVAGLTLGWIFWRWGLPYAMVCHSAVNATHALLQDVVYFGSRNG